MIYGFGKSNFRHGTSVLEMLVTKTCNASTLLCPVKVEVTLRTKKGHVERVVVEGMPDVFRNVLVFTPQRLLGIDLTPYLLEAIRRVERPKAFEVNVNGKPYWFVIQPERVVLTNTRNWHVAVTYNPDDCCVKLVCEFFNKLSMTQKFAFGRQIQALIESYYPQLEWLWLLIEELYEAAENGRKAREAAGERRQRKAAADEEKGREEANIPWRKVTPQILAFLGELKSSANPKSLHRKLAMQHHPDRGGDTAVMAAVNAAWEIFIAM